MIKVIILLLICTYTLPLTATQNEIVTKNGKVYKNIKVIIAHPTELELIFENDKSIRIHCFDLPKDLQKKYKFNLDKIKQDKEQAIKKAKVKEQQKEEKTKQIKARRKSSKANMMAALKNEAAPHFIIKSTRFKNYKKKGYQGFAEGEIIYLVDINGKKYMRDDGGNIYVRDYSCPFDLSVLLVPAEDYLKDIRGKIKNYKKTYEENDKEIEDLKKEIKENTEHLVKLTSDKIVVGENAYASRLLERKVKLVDSLERKVSKAETSLRRINKEQERNKLILEYLIVFYVDCEKRLAAGKTKKKKDTLFIDDLTAGDFINIMKKLKKREDEKKKAFELNLKKKLTEHQQLCKARDEMMEKNIRKMLGRSTRNQDKNQNKFEQSVYFRFFQFEKALANHDEFKEHVEERFNPWKNN